MPDTMPSSDSGERRQGDDAELAHARALVATALRALNFADADAAAAVAVDALRNAGLLAI